MLKSESGHATHEGLSRQGPSKVNRGPNRPGNSYDPELTKELRNRNDYSLRQDAPSTQRYNFLSNIEGGLRHRNVNFVRASASDQSELADSSAALANMTLEVPMEIHGNGAQMNDDLSLIQECVLSKNTSLITGDRDEISDLFVIDIKGDQSLIKNSVPPQLRSSSPTPSISSDEVILFAGRDHAGRGMSRLSSGHQTISDPCEALIKSIKPNVGGRQTLLAAKSKKIEGWHIMQEELCCDGTSLSSIKSDIGLYSEGRCKDLILRPEGRCFNGIRNSPKKYWTRSRRDVKRDGAQLIIDDYIANMEEQGSNLDNIYSQRDLGGTDGDVYLTGSRSTRLNEKYEVGDSQLARSIGGEIGSGPYIQKNTAGDHHMEGIDDNKDSLQWRNDYVMEEKATRLLAKQEELGRGSSELLHSDDSSEVGNDDHMLKNVTGPKQNRAGQRNQASSRKSKNGFLSTAASATVYDVMSSERLSCKKKAKSCRSKLPFDVSNSELEASMQLTRAKDQSQKRQRKEEREKARIQGLLGQKNAKPDLKKKYQEGMTLDNVKDEIRNFLMSNNTTLALPPMDKADRKVVHELANLLNIKSRSAGMGIKRFPILHRTSRTLYVESKFAAVEANLTRRYLPRMDMGGNNYRSTPKRPGRGGLANTAIRYRDGDIVGGSAPELGMDNKGRAMLQRMGWSTGTALGAVDNKGILQPVSHVVKITKAGLS